MESIEAPLETLEAPEETLVAPNESLEPKTCDPDIEVCEAAPEEALADPMMAPAERPDPMATYILGMVAVLKALVPMTLKLTASDTSAKMTSIWNPAAGLLWWVGNLLVWLPLMIMWPLTYSGTLVDPYL